MNTFTNYHNASGQGPSIAAGQWVHVSCKVHDPTIQSVNPDGYWYQIADSPWNSNYYAPANTFMNGDPYGGPYTHNTDFAVPDCGAAPSSPPPPTPTPAPPPPSASLAQGPAAPSGYRYAISVSHFAANSAVSVSCRDSVSPSGFYTFTLVTDSSGSASTSSYCFSNDGPDHWVFVNGNTQSNHVTWGPTSPPPSSSTGGGAAPGSGSAPPPANPPSSGAQPGAGSPSIASGSSSAPVCTDFSGYPIGNSGHVSRDLLAHYLDGTGLTAAINWAYFSGNPVFRTEVLPMAVGATIGWQAPSASDMQLALGHFTIQHPSPGCYVVIDRYDFDWDTNKKNLVYFPLWLDSKANAKEFDIRASGAL